MVGNSSTVTVTPSMDTTPSFRTITTSSMSIRVETPNSTTSRVFWINDDDAIIRGGEIVIYFGNL